MANFLEGLEYAFKSILEIFVIFANSTSRDYGNGTVEDDFSKNFSTEYNLFGVSIVFLITFAFLTKRDSFKKDKCYGRPGLAIPMDMISRHNHTFEYVLAFLVVSEDIYLLVARLELISLSLIEIFFLKMLFGMFVSLASYQIFAAIHIDTVIGYVLGIISTGVFSIYHFYDNYMTITSLKTDEKYPLIFLAMVRLGIYFILFSTFLWKLITFIKVKCVYIHSPIATEADDLNQCYEYVRTLLNNPRPNSKNMEHKNRTFLDILKDREITDTLKNRVYLRITGFTNPPRLFIGLSVGFYFAFRIFIDEIVDMTPTGWNMIRIIQSKYSETKLDLRSAYAIASGNYSLYSKREIENAYRYLTMFYTNLLINCFVSAVVLGFLNTIIQIFLILRNYRLSFLRINRKGFSSIIALKNAPAAHKSISGFVKYSGYQAAYILWGVTIVTGFVFVILFIFIGIFLLPLIYIENSWTRITFFRYLPLIVATLIFNFTQDLIVKYAFTKEKGKLMEINNRRAFTIYTHFAFFFNTMIGIFNSLIRIFIWIVSGIICFCRIDFSSLPIYLHNFDTGYMTYLGFLYTEQFHHNPILKCFVHLLLESQTEIRNYKIIPINESFNDIPFRKTRYHWKWKVAFTLINNPQLQVYRKKKNMMVADDVIL